MQLKFNATVAKKIAKLLNDDGGEQFYNASGQLHVITEESAKHNFLGTVQLLMTMQCPGCTECGTVAERFGPVIYQPFTTMSQAQFQHLAKGMSAIPGQIVTGYINDRMSEALIPLDVATMFMLGLSLGRWALLNRPGLNLVELSDLIDWFAENDYNGNDGFDRQGISFENKHRSEYASTPIATFGTPDENGEFFQGGGQFEIGSFNQSDLFIKWGYDNSNDAMLADPSLRPEDTLLGMLKVMKAYNKGTNIFEMLSQVLGDNPEDFIDNLGGILSRVLGKQSSRTVRQGPNGTTIDARDDLISVDSLQPDNFGITLRNNQERDKIIGIGFIADGRLIFGHGASTFLEQERFRAENSIPEPQEEILTAQQIDELLQDKPNIGNKLIDWFGTNGIMEGFTEQDVRNAKPPTKIATLSFGIDKQGRTHLTSDEPDSDDARGQAIHEAVDAAISDADGNEIPFDQILSTLGTKLGEIDPSIAIFGGKRTAPGEEMTFLTPDGETVGSLDEVLGTIFDGDDETPEIVKDQMVTSEPQEEKEVATV
jgi:hypothetical protein